MTSSIIIPDEADTGEQPAVEPRHGGWISDGSRPPGRHRADRPHLVHVSAIEGVQLARSPRRVGAVADSPSAPGLLARLIGGAR